MTRTEFKAKVAAMIQRQAPAAKIEWKAIKAEKKIDRIDPDASWSGWRAEVEFFAPGFISRKVVATHRKGFRINETEVRPVTDWAHLMVAI